MRYNATREVKSEIHRLKVNEKFSSETLTGRNTNSSIEPNKEEKK